MGITKVERDGKEVLEYRFQPKLEDGTAIGGEQVVYGDNYEELMEKQAENYNHLYRKNRELLRQEKLSGKAPEGSVQALPEATFKPRPLTAEERMRFARDINDPEKADAALDLVLGAKFGASPQVFSQSVNNNSTKAAAIYAAQQAAAWRDAHPEFYASKKNCEDIASYIKNRNIEFTYENFEQAYEELSPALETAPPSVARTEPKPVPDTTSSRITETGSGATQRQTETSPVLPTTVSRKTGTTRGTAKKDGVTAEQFRKMSNSERKDFMRKNPNYTFA